MQSGPTASAAQVKTFFDSWQEYADRMQQKVSDPPEHRKFGENLSASNVELTPEQQAQLKKLRQETQRGNRK
jgi:Spy/CpxP family protein refolding chaperone